jgi:hypothetical protein
MDLYFLSALTYYIFLDRGLLLFFQILQNSALSLLSYALYTAYLSPDFLELIYSNPISLQTDLFDFSYLSAHGCGSKPKY